MAIICQKQWGNEKYNSNFLQTFNFGRFQSIFYLQNKLKNMYLLRAEILVFPKGRFSRSTSTINRKFSSG